MTRKLLIALGLIMASSTAVFAIGDTFIGPGYWITGNDTGGIIPYSPAIETTYKQMATDWCARWNRLSHVTSVHRVYGDYVSFVCIDKPWMTH
jgi:hypothetical protein